MTQSDLMLHLAQNSTRLIQAAIDKLLDSSLLYDSIYLAVIKTRQKYKKLVNKDRAVEVCISLMRQPRKHVKQNFSSVEDCIEKAMAAKIVPWKPIISAVTIVLAAAIVIPFCLPKEPPVIDPKGFVMEGTQAFANRVEGNDVQLKNFHKISDLGAADIRELANIELCANGSDLGDAQYRIHTTNMGITFLAQVYVNADTKKSEFILYRGDTDGWHEVGRDTTRFVVEFVPTDGELKSYYHADDALTMFSDQDGNLYILSCYNEGIQVHQYSVKGTFSRLDRIWMQEHKQISLPSGYRTTLTTFSASYDSVHETISLIYEHEIEFSVFAMSLVSFDLREGVFSSSVPITGEFSKIEAIYAITPDNDGGFYFLGSENIIYSETSWDSYYYIYRCNQSGAITEKILYGERIKNSSNRVTSYLMEVQGESLHFVYRIGTITYYSVYQNGKEISKTRVPAVTIDSQNYMAFFFHDNTLYYMVEINNKYIVIAQVQESNVEKIAEFEIPLSFDERAFIESRGNKKIHFTTTNGVLNCIIGEYDQANNNWEYISSYFFQIVLE